MKKIIILITIFVTLVNVPVWPKEKTYSMHGQWNWINSPTGREEFFNCEATDTNGIGRWHMAGIEGLYKITEGSFELRQATRDSYGRIVMVTILKGIWEINKAGTLIVNNGSAVFERLNYIGATPAEGQVWNWGD